MWKWASYLMVFLHVSSGAKIGDLHAKDSHSFCKRLIQARTRECGEMSIDL